MSVEAAKYLTEDCCSPDWGSLATTPSDTIRIHCLSKYMRVNIQFVTQKGYVAVFLCIMLVQT